MSVRLKLSRQQSSAFADWERERAVEIQQEQAAADAAQAADPVVAFQKSANEAAAIERNNVSTGVLDESYLKQFGIVLRGEARDCPEGEIVAARTEFRATTPDYVRNDANGQILCNFVTRTFLYPGAVESYALAHKILTLWGLYPEVVEQPEQPVVEPVIEQEVLTPSQQADKNYEPSHSDCRLRPGHRTRLHGVRPRHESRFQN
jgi:hypothetical protein